MKNQSLHFHFELVEKIRHLPGTLEISDYRRLLKALEVEDVESYDDDEIAEVTFMALQDIGAQDAVAIILSTLFEDQFTRGQAQNLAEELKEDRAWDEYSDLADHSALYVCADIMHSAFPAEYPKPSLSYLRIRIEAPELDAFLKKDPLDKAMVLRGIARSEERDSLLARLFPDQLKGGQFPEADWIIWLMKEASPAPNTRIIECYGSEYWLRGIESALSSTVEIPY